MVVFSVVSAKGGVGKTTITANMAMALAGGRNVVAVDLDPQNALRLHLDFARRKLTRKLFVQFFCVTHFVPHLIVCKFRRSHC